jgi:hypothetical protein
MVVHQNFEEGELAKFLAGYGEGRYAVLKPDARTAQIRACLRELIPEAELPKFSLHAEVTSPDPVLFKVIEKVGRSALERFIARFFPKASRARVFSVEGGWSGAPMCRFYLEGDPDQQEYFLKLHDDPLKYEREFTNHLGAQAWLGNCVVEPVPLAEISADPRKYKSVFAVGGRTLFPVCYMSASTEPAPRDNWKYVFSKEKTADHVAILDAVLGILRTNNAPYPIQTEFLWSVPEVPQKRAKAEPGPEAPAPYFRHLPLTTQMRIALKHALTDLEPYAEHMLAEVDRIRPKPAGRDWKTRSAPLFNLVRSILPEWLEMRHPAVALGHVHGDPNPRNCMVIKSGNVAPATPLVQMIDCGDYWPKGRLVWDLAVIERDIKLVLMETELGNGGFRDLDIGRLAEWCTLEDALASDLEFRPSQKLVEQLLAKVRTEVVRVCRPHDPRGEHYFAALLYCTLEILKEPEVRRTKKLLALYSACEILNAFDTP